MPYIIAFIIVIIAGIGFALSRPSNPTEITSPVTMVVEENEEIEKDEDVLTEENLDIIPDGTHTTSITYFTPKRDEYLLDISITTENGVITDSNIEYSQGAEADPNAQKFEAAYHAEIIGKKLDELDLSRVGGASLTTAAFNEAINKLLAEQA